MAVDSGQEVSEQDPVTAIRASLRQALGFLRKLLGTEEEELKEEMEEVEGEKEGEGDKPSSGVQIDKPAE